MRPNSKLARRWWYGEVTKIIRVSRVSSNSSVPCAFCSVSLARLSRRRADSGTPALSAWLRMVSALEGPEVSSAAPEKISFGAQLSLYSFMASATRAVVSPPLIATITSAGAHLTTSGSGLVQSLRSSGPKYEVMPEIARAAPVTTTPTVTNNLIIDFIIANL